MVCSFSKDVVSQLRRCVQTNFHNSICMHSLSTSFENEQSSALMSNNSFFVWLFYLFYFHKTVCLNKEWDSLGYQVKLYLDKLIEVLSMIPK